MSFSISTLRSLLEPFWDHLLQRRFGDRIPAGADTVPPETGWCVETAYLLAMACPEVRPVSGLFRDGGRRDGWSDHSMVLIEGHLLDLTQAQFPGRDPFVVFPLDASEVCVQTTRRINTARAPETAIFATLLNPPNPIGRRSVIEAYVRSRPNFLEDIRQAMTPVLRDLQQVRVEPDCRCDL